MDIKEVKSDIDEIANKAWKNGHGEIAQILFFVSDGIDNKIEFEMLQALSTISDD